METMLAWAGCIGKRLKIRVYLRELTGILLHLYKGCCCLGGWLRPGSGNKTHEEPVSQPRSGADLGTMEENGGNSEQSG